MSPSTERGAFAPQHLIVLVADLTGYHRGFRTHTDEEMADFLDRFYRASEAIVTEHGGRVVKFLGDATLAHFREDAASDAVAATVALDVVSARIAEDVGLESSLGANLHAGPVMCGDFGSGDSRSYDILGRTVNQTFLLGRGPGIRLSERVYRKLPSSERSPWDRRKPPAVYVLGASPEPYEAQRKTAAENAARW